MTRRNYQQYCGVAKALDLVGERWTLLIVRNLVLGPRTYTALLQGLPGITTNLLAKRLRELERSGIVQSVPAGYELTERGAALEPAILALGKWGSQAMGQPKRGETLDIGWGMLSLKNRYRTGRMLSSEWRIEDAKQVRVFELALGESVLVVKERTASMPQVQLQGSLDAFRSLMFRGQPLCESGITVEGTMNDARELSSRFIGMRYD